MAATPTALTITGTLAAPGVRLHHEVRGAGPVVVLVGSPMDRTVVAHEPPLEELLDDRERRRAATDRVITTYLSDGPGAAWALFLAEADIDEAGEHGPSGAQPEPAGGFPERDPQEVADERRFFLHELRATTRWVPDVEALRTGTPRVVVGLGEGSAGQLCDLTSTALARRLGVVPTLFPGDHVGFVEHPEAFARRLREVLDAG